MFYGNVGSRFGGAYMSNMGKSVDSLAAGLARTVMNAALAWQERISVAASGWQHTSSDSPPPAFRPPPHFAAGDRLPRFTVPNWSGPFDSFATDLKKTFAEAERQVYQQLSDLEANLNHWMDQAARDVQAVLHSLGIQSPHGFWRPQGTGPMPNNFYHGSGFHYSGPHFGAGGAQWPPPGGGPMPNNFSHGSGFDHSGQHFGAGGPSGASTAHQSEGATQEAARKDWISGVIGRRMEAAGAGSDRSKVLKAFVQEVKQELLGVRGSVDNIKAYFDKNKQLFGDVSELGLNDSEFPVLAMSLIRTCTTEAKPSSKSTPSG
jgi:hypothetical protein